MTKKQEKQIRDFIIKEYFDEDERKEDMLLSDYEVVELTSNLEVEGLISFTFQERTLDCDYYIVAETGIWIKGEGFIGITFDSGVILEKKMTLDDVVNKIIKYEEKAKEILKKLEILKTLK